MQEKNPERVGKNFLLETDLQVEVDKFHAPPPM